MKKIFSILVLVILLFLIVQPQTYANQQDESERILKQQYQELLEQSGANELYKEVPEDAKKLMEQNGINGIETEKFLEMNFFDFIKATFKSAKEALAKPLSILLSGIGIILLTALLNSLKTSFSNSSYDKVFSTVSVMCIATSIIIPISQIINKSATLIKQVSNFMLSFIPVYAGIITASGKPLSAVSYNTSIIAVVQVISRITSCVLVPLLTIYLAFCLIGSASSNINMEGITKTIKTIVIIALSFMLTIFVGLLSVQGVVSTAADTITLKAVKFSLNAFLPVVGAAISEALNSVQGCMGLIKASVGGFGVVAIICTFLPSVITILLMQLSLSVVSIVSEMLETPRITALMKSASSVLTLILGILLVFFVLLVVCITVMLALGTSGA